MILSRGSESIHYMRTLPVLSGTIMRDYLHPPGKGDLKSRILESYHKCHFHKILWPHSSKFLASEVGAGVQDTLVHKALPVLHLDTADSQ